MNIVVVLEDQATKQRQEGKPYAFASALEVPCLCGHLIHPSPGAWCTQCGAKVVEVRPQPKPGGSDLRRSLSSNEVGI